MEALLLVFAGYLLGSIPFGYLVAKYGYNLDIRKYGSGNIGVTNILRVCGKKAAGLVFCGDVLKGTLAGLLGVYGGNEIIAVLVGLAAIAGHVYPLFLGFKGGKAVATGFGVTLALAPVVALILLGLWSSSIYLTRYVSVGSLLAAISIPILMYLFHEPLPYFIFGFLGGGFVIYKHIPNVKRLWNGTEYKIGQKVDR